MNTTTTILMTLTVAFGAAACAETESASVDAVELTFKDAVVHAHALGADQVRADVTDHDGAVQASLVWDQARGEGVLDDHAGARSERIALDGEAVALPLELVAEMAYESWRGRDDDKLRYGDCYWAGTTGGGIECCWGNRGWNCIVWN